MLIAFFDIKCIVYFEFIPQGQTVNQTYYVEILKRLREAMLSERPELWPNDWNLHHDNAPAHKELSVKNFLAKKPINEMEHPSFFPGLAPTNFWLFPEIKSVLKDENFRY